MRTFSIAASFFLVLAFTAFAEEGKPTEATVVAETTAAPSPVTTTPTAEAGVVVPERQLADLDASADGARGFGFGFAGPFAGTSGNAAALGKLGKRQLVELEQEDAARGFGFGFAGPFAGTSGNAGALGKLGKRLLAARGFGFGFSGPFAGTSGNAGALGKLGKRQLGDEAAADEIHV